jgi:prophage tail gpP-like protein
MPKVQENVRLIVGGKTFRDWKSVEVTASSTESARSFTLDVAEGAIGLMNAEWVCKPGTECEIYAGSDLLLKGVIDDYEPSFSGTTHKIKVAGRSKSAHTVDSSANHRTGRFENKTIDQIANELGQQVGVRYRLTEQAGRISHFQLRPGETIHNAVERLTRDNQLMLTGMPDGSVEIGRARDDVMGQLVQGVNILEGKSKLSAKKRARTTTVRGQNANSTTGRQQRQEATVTDPTFTGNAGRTIIIVNERDATDEQLRRRARWDASRRAGEGTTSQITVVGWRNDKGQLWEPKKQVYVKSSFLKIDQNMAIKSVTYTQSADGGTTCALELVDPAALGGKKKGRSSSDAAHSTPAATSSTPAAPAPAAPAGETPMGTPGVY